MVTAADPQTRQESRSQAESAGRPHGCTSMRFRSASEPLVPLQEALDALGDDGHLATYGDDEVPVASIIGSAARSHDFDRDFRPRRPTARHRRVRELFAAGRYPPPLDLVRLGECYFVVDGHHRLAVARERGWVAVPARVRHFCTVAFARCCLSVSHLATLAAQKRFLDEVPLPDDVRRSLWLDHPADWSRLSDAALAWAYRRQAAGGTAFVTPFDLASAWWYEFVQPAVARLREDGERVDLGDLQLLVTALARRDRLDEMDLRRPDAPTGSRAS